MQFLQLFHWPLVFISFLYIITSKAFGFVVFHDDMVFTNPLKKKIFASYTNSVVALKKEGIESKLSICKKDPLQKIFPIVEKNVICTGVFITHSIVLTAGHCFIQKQKSHSCGDYYWQFSSGAKVKCEKILYKVENRDLDFALTKVSVSKKYPVVPLRLWNKENIPYGFSTIKLAKIGYGLGIPLVGLKYTMIGHTSRQIFTDHNNFSGDSGGPLLNIKNIEKEGIKNSLLGIFLLGANQKSFEFIPKKKCFSFIYALPESYLYSYFLKTEAIYLWLKQKRPWLLKELQH